jgi:hypothetical protein
MDRTVDFVSELHKRSYDVVFIVCGTSVAWLGNNKQRYAVQREELVMRKQILNRFLMGLVALLSVGVVSASASTITYEFNLDHCTGDCFPPNPIGSVTLTDLAAGTVQVDVDLADGVQFVTSGFDGTFAFNLIGNLTVSLTLIDPTSGWTLVSSPPLLTQFDGFGSFEYALTCDVCVNGASNAQDPPLSFTLTGSGLSVLSFAELSTGASEDAAYFVADVISGGNTGLVGAGRPGECTIGCVTEDDIPVPESGSLLLLGSALVATAAGYRRRNRR